MPENKKSTIRLQLCFLVAACVLPVWLLAAVMVRHAYVTKLDQVNRDMLVNARGMSLVVDRELANVQASLAALATSPSFRKRDLAALYLQCKEILLNYPGADIVIADRDGQQLVNTYPPFGSVLPKRNNLGMVRRIFETGKPQVSDLFRGAVTKRPLIAIDVPVLIDGKVAFDLSMTFSSDKLSTILQSKNVFKEWYGAVLDRNGVITARTGNLGDLVGKQAGVELRRAAAAAGEGTIMQTFPAKEEAFTAFAKSSYSGWTVAFGVPKWLVLRQIYLWVAWTVAGVAAISMLGILLATFIGRRIAKDVLSLVEPALAIGQGRVVTSIRTESVKETTEVAEALVQASELLQRRETERDLAERQRSLAIDELRYETGEKIRALEELRRQEQLLTQQSRQAALGEMIGNIAHQWRQPLNALGLMVQQPPLFYELGQVDREYLEEHTRKTMQIVQHMSQTIDDFRSFFRPDKERVRFRIAEEVNKTLSLVDGGLQSLNIAVELKLEGDPFIVGYPNEFSQVLLNILLNARDAIVERAVEAPRVLIAIGEERQRSVVVVTDNAGGIPEGIIDKIFDPYFTTKGPQAGTGVGLFMSKTIIEKNMGGALSARNVPGGAEFRIEV